MLLRLDGIARRIGGRTLFENATLEVNAGDRVGLVGPNGAGKSTLLYIAAGEEPPDAGSVLVPKKVRVRRLRQEIDPGQRHSVRAEAITQYTGLPFKVRDLVSKITEQVESREKRVVAV